MHRVDGETLFTVRASGGFDEVDDGGDVHYALETEYKTERFVGMVSLLDRSILVIAFG